MSVIVGSASINEFGKVSGGRPGDQGQEIYIRPWYANGWTDMVRPIDPDLAEKIASNYEAICANPYIGYGQDKRLTLYNEAKKVGFDFSKIATPCEADCSSSEAADLIGAGVNVSPSIYTGNMVAAIMKTGKFEHHRESDFLTNDRKLKRGDILVKQYYHTVVVLSDGEDAMPEPDDGYRYVDTDELNVRTLPSMSGTVLAALPFASQVELLAEDGDWARVRVEGYCAKSYLSKRRPKTSYVTTDNLNLRQTPGNGKILLTIPAGATVQATGNTEIVDGVMWRGVIYAQKNGWCSGEYLK